MNALVRFVAQQQMLKSYMVVKTLDGIVNLGKLICGMISFENM
jgi:hypothetical protein